MIIRADLHIHSCLSPCGDLSMSPRAIAGTLASRGVNLAALTDHNSALNCPAFDFACREAGIAALFGIEAQTREECHMLCLFAEPETALKLGEELYAVMPPVPNNPGKMGDQVYVDENEDILGEVEKYLVTSADIGIDELADRVHELGGIAVPAHADRPAFSLVSQLGFIPEGNWDALELVRLPLSEPAARELDTRGYPLITSSDAHYIEHLARRPFDLDIADAPLLRADGRVDMETIRAALARRPR